MIRRFFPFTFNQGTSGGVGYLDAYPGAFRAFSTKKVYSDYSGFCIQVTKTGIADFQDIGFDLNGNLDESALLSYAGSDNVFIEKWYDQSGNSRDFNGITRPRIVSSGVIEKIGDIPVINFYVSNANLNCITDAWPSDFNLFYHFQSTETATHVWFGTNTANNTSLISADGSSSTTIYLDYGTPSFLSNGALVSITNRNQAHDNTRPEKIVGELGANISGWSPDFLRLGSTGQGSGRTFKTGDWIEFEGPISESDGIGISNAINVRHQLY